MFIEINKLKIKPHTLVHLSTSWYSKCEKNSKKAFELNEGATKWYKAAKLSELKIFYLFLHLTFINQLIHIMFIQILSLKIKGQYGKTKLKQKKKLIFLSKIKDIKIDNCKSFSVIHSMLEKVFNT